MPPRPSAGLLPYRRVAGLEVLVGHLGGPFWTRKDDAAWTLPKGEVEDGEDPLDTARREFVEELGLPVPAGPMLDLGEVRQAGGKRVRAWAVEAAGLDLDAFTPGTVTIAWPPRSGRTLEVPELDRVAWLDLEAARPRLVAAQREFLDRLREALATGPGPTLDR